MIKMKRGLNLPIAGSPEQVIEDVHDSQRVAILGYDYPGLKPTMEVVPGDSVIKGQLLFADKKGPGLKYTSPGTGTVIAINRGDRRAFQSVVIELDGDAEMEFDVSDTNGMSRDSVVSILVETGEWAALRTRPYNKVPLPDSVPVDIFVTAMDSRPLAPDPRLFIKENSEAFVTGLEVLAKLTEGRVFVCAVGDADLPLAADNRITLEEFSGPHPAGLAGTHIHFLSPASQNRTVWHVGYQNVIAIGHLFTTGKIFSERVVALAGPGIEKPRLIRTRVGACLSELTKGEIKPGEYRVLSGSVLDGREATGASFYLGRYHNQISVLLEGTEREFLGFIKPGFDKFSLTRLFASSLLGLRTMNLTTNRGGSERAMVPLGTYEEVMPLDILPTQLLRALLVSDVDSAISLGCLELDEEDLALCTFACPGKYEYGPYLREMLTKIEAEG